MGFITASREQQVLFGYSLDEFVPKDAKCRFIVEVVKELNLFDLFNDYSDQGGAAFDPSVMLSTWFFAYSEGVTSTRELEQRCLRDMHFIYVSGNLRPDHTSLSRFRKRHLERLPGLFVQMVRLARERGVSDFRRICVDGTRLKANASPEHSVDSSGLDKALRQVREDIEGYLRECELADSEGTDVEETEARLAELRRLEQTYLERQRQLKERKERLNPQNRPRHRINTTDPDALCMKKVNGARGVPGYSGQASVDAASGLIVAADAASAANDTGQFSAQHAQVEQTLGTDGQRQYVADAGYHSLDELEYIEQNHVDAVIADPREDRRSTPTAQGVPEGDGHFRRADFHYDATSDTYVCPAGETLSFRNEWTDAHGTRFRIYGRWCTACVHARRCCKGNGQRHYKRVFRNVREKLAEDMARKAQSEEGRSRMNERFARSESVFGNLKENLGFRGVRLRGLASVRGEFLLMCLGHNLNRLFRLLGTAASGPLGGPNPTTTVRAAFCRLMDAFMKTFFASWSASSATLIPIHSVP